MEDVWNVEKKWLAIAGLARGNVRHLFICYWPHSNVKQQQQSTNACLWGTPIVVVVVVTVDDTVH